MKRHYILIVLILFMGVCQSQSTAKKRDSLIQLNKPKTVLDNYLNFDVPKIMIGQGFATGGQAPANVNLSIKGQFLWPYALSKRHLKIAYGLTFGSSKITSVSAEYKFQVSELSSIVSNKAIKRTMIRTGYIGLAAFHVIRLRGVTVLTGPSLEYNISCKIKEVSGNGKRKFSGKNYINDFSIPINLQISISKRQFFSIGFFGSYDLTPRFKGGNFKNMKQAVIGVSGAVII